MKINFTKMVASGNDFVVVRALPGLRLAKLARRICDRKFGIGADGLLILEKSKKADIRMRIFNADGSEAQMCGNGARCVALYFGRKLKIETKAGAIAAKVSKDNIQIRLTEPKGIKLDIPIKLGTRALKVNFINTGVPHVVIFTQGLDAIEITALAKYIRYHKKFAPQGANVDFVEVLNNNSLKVRTYERGVEDETLACGTGSVAAALIFSLKGARGSKINLLTKSKEILRIYFNRQGSRFSNVWLEGKAAIVYKGVYDV